MPPDACFFLRLSHFSQCATLASSLVVHFFTPGLSAKCSSPYVACQGRTPLRQCTHTSVPQPPGMQGRGASSSCMCASIIIAWTGAVPGAPRAWRPGLGRLRPRTSTSAQSWLGCTRPPTRGAPPWRQPPARPRRLWATQAQAQRTHARQPGGSARPHTQSRGGSSSTEHTAAACRACRGCGRRRRGRQAGRQADREAGREGGRGLACADRLCVERVVGSQVPQGEAAFLRDGLVVALRRGGRRAAGGDQHGVVPGTVKSVS
jgi:hypothetical protein